MNNQEKKLSVAIIGATGAVGTQALHALMDIPQVTQISTFGRRPVPGLDETLIEQHQIDIFQPSTYAKLLSGHDVAICTLGVGQPSKMSKEEFLKIDKTAVLDFAKACKEAGIGHFELLSSVGIDAQSRSFFLRAKGELVEELKALNFERLSIFQPSMILTPTNRYGFVQALTLWTWPLLHPLLIGGAKKYRGIKVDQLGKAFSVNILHGDLGLEYLTWDDFQMLNW